MRFLALRPYVDQPDLAQDPQMPGHGRLGQPVQVLDQLTGRSLPLREQVEDLPPARLRDRLEYVHAEKYYNRRI